MVTVVGSVWETRSSSGSWVVVTRSTVPLGPWTGLATTPKRGPSGGGHGGQDRPHRAGHPPRRPSGSADPPGAPDDDPSRHRARRPSSTSPARPTSPRPHDMTGMYVRDHAFAVTWRRSHRRCRRPPRRHRHLPALTVVGRGSRRRCTTTTAPRTSITGRRCSSRCRPAAPRPTVPEVHAMSEEHADIDPAVTAVGDAFAAVVEDACEEHRNALDIRLAACARCSVSTCATRRPSVLPLVQRVMTTTSSRRSRRRSRSPTRGGRCRSSWAGRWTAARRRTPGDVHDGRRALPVLHALVRRRFERAEARAFRDGGGGGLSRRLQTGSVAATRRADQDAVIPHPAASIRCVRRRRPPPRARRGSPGRSPRSRRVPTTTEMPEPPSFPRAGGGARRSAGPSPRRHRTRRPGARTDALVGTNESSCDGGIGARARSAGSSSMPASASTWSSGVSAEVVRWARSYWTRAARGAQRLTAPGRQLAVTYSTELVHSPWRRVAMPSRIVRMAWASPSAEPHVVDQERQADRDEVEARVST